MISLSERKSCGSKFRTARKKFGVNSPAQLSKLMNAKYGVSGILKRERGEIKIDLEYATDFCNALKIKGNDRFQLLELTKLFLLQFNPWQQSHKGVSKLQLDYWKHLLACEKFFDFQTSGISSVLQTEEYRYEILRAHGIDHLTAIKAARQRFDLAKDFLASYAHDSRAKTSGPTKIRLIIHENALYQAIGSSKVATLQIMYILSLKLREEFMIRILPRSRVIPNFPLLYSFSVFDSNLVLMETATGGVYSGNFDSIDWLMRGADAIFEQSVSEDMALKILNSALEYHDQSNS